MSYSTGKHSRTGERVHNTDKNSDFVSDINNLAMNDNNNSMIENYQQEATNEDSSANRQKKLRRISQACATCARKKVKCDGRQPCSQCAESRKECIYPEAKKRGPVKGFKRDKPGNTHDSGQAKNNGHNDEGSKRGRSASSGSPQHPPQRQLSPRSESAYALASMQPSPNLTPQPLSPLTSSWPQPQPPYPDTVSSSSEHHAGTSPLQKIIPVPGVMHASQIAASAPAQPHQQYKSAYYQSDGYRGPSSGFPRNPYETRPPRGSDKYGPNSPYRSPPSNTSTFDIGVPDQVTRILVDVYYRFVHQVWPFVHKQSESIDEIIQTYPKVLLYAMCSLANFIAQVDSNYNSEPEEIGARYARGAKRLLWESDFKSDFPSIQALLLLALRQNGSGNAATGWQLLGIAQRMIIDLGIHRGDRSQKEFTPNITADELEERRRVYWACYIMTQMTTAALGRMVVFRAEDGDVPLPSIHGPEETQEWDGGPTLATKLDPLLKGQPSRSLSTFKALASLAQILESIISEIYTTNKTSHEDETLKKLQSRLGNWFTGLPEGLVFDRMKLNYRLPQQLLCMGWGLACQILLYRPFVPKQVGDGIENPLTCCTVAANAVCSVTEVYARNFDLRRVAGSFVFTLFTGATIHALNTGSVDKSISEQAHENLNKSLHWLDIMANTWSAGSQHKHVLLAILANRTENATPTSEQEVKQDDIPNNNTHVFPSSIQSNEQQPHQESSQYLNVPSSYLTSSTRVQSTQPEPSRTIETISPPQQTVAPPPQPQPPAIHPTSTEASTTPTTSELPQNVTDSVSSDGSIQYPYHNGIIMSPNTVPNSLPLMTDEQALFWTNMPISSEDPWSWLTFTTQLPSFDASDVSKLEDNILNKRLDSNSVQGPIGA